MHLNFFHTCLFYLIRLYCVYSIYSDTHKSTEYMSRGLLTNTKRWSSQLSFWALTCPYLPDCYTSFSPLLPLLPCLRTTLSLQEKSFLPTASANLILAFILISCKGQGVEVGDVVRLPYIILWKKRLDIFIGKSIPKLWDWRRP